MCLEDIKQWIDAYIHPADFLRRKKGTKWGEAFQQVIESGFASGIVLGFFLMILIGVGVGLASLKIPIPIPGTSGWGIGFATWMISMLAFPVYLAITWFTSTMPLYASARLFGGQANFEEHSSSLAWVAAPLAFISSWILWIPVAGQILEVLLLLYTLYPLTIVLRDTHKIETWQAVCAWLFWVIILALAFLAGGTTILSTVKTLLPMAKIPM